jgi:hypothetical protein
MNNLIERLEQLAIRHGGGLILIWSATEWLVLVGRTNSKATGASFEIAANSAIQNLDDDLDDLPYRQDGEPLPF